MERIDHIITHPVEVWERYVSKRDDMALKKINFNKGLVSGAEGTIIAGGKERNVKWIHNGRCYYRGKRVKQFDIHFTAKPMPMQ